MSILISIIEMEQPVASKYEGHEVTNRWQFCKHPSRSSKVYVCMNSMQYVGSSITIPQMKYGNWTICKASRHVTFLIHKKNGAINVQSLSSHDSDM